MKECLFLLDPLAQRQPGVNKETRFKYVVRFDRKFPHIGDFLKYNIDIWSGQNVTHLSLAYYRLQFEEFL